MAVKLSVEKLGIESSIDIPNYHVACAEAGCDGCEYVHLKQRDYKTVMMTTGKSSLYVHVHNDEWDEFFDFLVEKVLRRPVR